LILWGRSEAGNVWMAGQQLSNRFSQGAGAVAVDYADFTLAVQESCVEKFVDDIGGFVRGPADKINLA
jgi:hypothetical protein